MFRRFESNIAVIDDYGTSLSYNELFDYAEVIVDVIPQRSVIFILCANNIASLAAYIGCLNKRIVPLLLSSKVDKELLHNLIGLYQPMFLWMPSDLDALDEKWKVEHSSNGYVLYKLNNELYNIDDSLALLLSTSGSTGSPKLVRQSYKNIIANTISIVEYLQINCRDRAITTLPMNYTYGLSIINTHLMSGATILLTDKTIIQRGFWDFFNKHHATTFGGVPYTYEILNKIKFFEMDLSSLKYITQAGGKLQPELHKKYAEYAIDKGIKFIVMYGQTEATARMSYLPFEKSLEKYGSIGVAIPGGRFEIIDANEIPINTPDTVGELVYYGENVTLGYAENRFDLEKGDERYGKLVTGDMAQRDIDGFYYIVGRKKRFLKVFGNRINLDELEVLIRKEFPMILCACCGVDDKLVIFVETQNKETCTGIRRFISEITRLNMSAINVKVMSVIPKNESGKILYLELQERMLEDEQLRKI